MGATVVEDLKNPSTSPDTNIGVKDGHTSSDDKSLSPQTLKRKLDSLTATSSAIHSDIHCLKVDSHEPTAFQNPFVASSDLTGDVCEPKIPQWENGFVPNRQLKNGPFYVYSSREPSQSHESMITNPLKRTREIGIIRKKAPAEECASGPVGIAADLVYKCVESAALDAGLCPIRLLESCEPVATRKGGQSSYIKSTRKYIDDVTVMVLELHSF